MTPDVQREVLAVLAEVWANSSWTCDAASCSPTSDSSARRTSDEDSGTSTTMNSSLSCTVIERSC